MFELLAVQEPNRRGRPASSWVDSLQKNLEGFVAIPRNGKGRKRIAFGVVDKDGQDLMAAAKTVGMWHQGAERGTEALDGTWRCAHLTPARG